MKPRPFGGFLTGAIVCVYGLFTAGRLQDFAALSIPPPPPEIFNFLCLGGAVVTPGSLSLANRKGPAVAGPFGSADERSRTSTGFYSH